MGTDLDLSKRRATTSPQRHHDTTGHNGGGVVSWCRCGEERMVEDGRRMSSIPNRAYYEACAGRWACTLDFAITDWRAWRSSRMALAGRLNLLALAWAVRLIGPLR